MPWRGRVGQRRLDAQRRVHPRPLTAHMLLEGRRVPGPRGWLSFRGQPDTELPPPKGSVGDEAPAVWPTGTHRHPHFLAAATTRVHVLSTSVSYTWSGFCGTPSLDTDHKVLMMGRRPCHIRM